MSRDVATHLRGALRRWALAARAEALRAGGLVRALPGRLRRLQLDPTARLITSTDAIEAGAGKVSRGLRGVLAKGGVGLTAGLVWRSVAALTGIGLAATLVTALSPGLAESGTAAPSLASLTVQPAEDSRVVRDVRRDPLGGSALEGSWIVLANPVAMFGLDSPELDRQAPVYEARHVQAEARRRDDLSFGSFAGDRPYLQLRLQVEHGARPAALSFVISLVREAAERGMSIQRSGLASVIATRFGPVETSDVTLSDGEASRSCIVFRKSHDELPLGLSGWWCGGPDRPADRQQLICMIDRIDLLNAGDDRVLRGAFAKTELARQPACASPRLSASGRKTSWLDADGKAPGLRTRTATAGDPPKPHPKR